MTKTAETSLFAEAAEFLETREWGQNGFTFVRKGQRHYCVVGAIQTCAMSNPHLSNKRSDSALDQLDAIVSSQHGETDVIEWNDEDERTKEEVIALLREADNQQRTHGRLNA